MNYNFKELSPFVHQYDFPISNLLTPYIDDIIKQFVEHYNEKTGYNSVYLNKEINPIIIDNFIELIKTNYKVSSRIKETNLFVYYQDQNFKRNVYHNHYTSSTLNAVYYLKLPQTGGGIEFIDQADKYTLQPEVDKLYVFPYWLTHRPLPHTGDDYRISINLEYFCLSRPRHYQTGIIW